MQGVVVDDFFRGLQPVLEFTFGFGGLPLLQLTFWNLFLCQAAVVFNRAGVDPAPQCQVAGIAISQTKNVDMFSWRFCEEKIGVFLQVLQL